MKTFCASVAFLMLTGAASAQVAVTRFGSSDAELCYQDALGGLSRDASNCDEALRDKNLNGRDRRATIVNRAIIFNRSGRAAEALEDLDEALQEEPTLAEALLNRGNSHYLLGRYDAALGDYEAALDNGLKKAEVAWYDIGLAYEAKKKLKEARAAYAKALEINPDFASAREKLVTLG